MSDGGAEQSPGGEIVVYGAPDGAVRLDVSLDRDTVWLTQRQMAEVFDTTPENVLMHLRNVFSSKELDAEATTKDFLVVRSEGGRRVKRRIRHYDLDAIISVGYRVNSKRAVGFRRWATRTLREHLVRGYTLHERRLAERGLREARETLDLLARTLQNQALVDETGRAVLDLISGYADTWRLLLEFDEDRLAVPAGAKPATSALDYEPPGAHRAYPAHRRERAAQQGPDGSPRRQSAGKAGRVTRFTESGVEDPALGMARRPRPAPWPWSRHCPDRPRRRERIANVGAIFSSPGWDAPSGRQVRHAPPANLSATTLAVIAAVNAVIALIYYARVGKTMWMDPLPEDGPDAVRLARPLSGSLALVLGICALFVIVAGVLPF